MLIHNKYQIVFLFFVLIFLTIKVNAQTDGCQPTPAKTTINTSMAIVISSADTETIWNALRFANFALGQKDTVRVFLIGKGVEAPKMNAKPFDVKKQLEMFKASGGQLFACGTCLEIRHEKGSELCPVSSMSDLYLLIRSSAKIITF